MRPLRCSVLILLLLAAPLGALAQPAWQTVMMTPGTFLFDLCLLEDGQHGWAVGGQSLAGEVQGVLFRTTDGGAHWTGVDFPYAAEAQLTGVCFVDASRGWIVGSGGRIYASTDGGESWTPQTSGTGLDLSSVYFLDAQRGWITGEGDNGHRHLVLRTSDGGAHWENLSFGSSCHQNDCIFFADDQQGWISGWDNTLAPHIHHTQDGGQSWERQDLPLPPGAGTVSQVQFVDTQLGWATVSSLYQSPAGAILHTSDGGATWSVQAHTGLHYNYALDVRDAEHLAIAAVQILSPAQEQIWVSGDGGETWDVHAPPITHYTYGLQYVGAEIWIAAQYSTILRSRDEGASWEWQNHAPIWSSVAWSSPYDGWLVAGSHVLSDGYCLRTRDGGASWHRDQDAPGGSRVQFIDAHAGWMFFEGNAARIWRTVDGGQSWSWHSVGGGGWIEDVQFVNADRGWAHGGGGTIKRSDDGGVTWTHQASGTNDFVQAVDFITPSEGWAVGGYGGGNGFVRHTTDGGDQWLPQTPAYPHHFQDVTFLDDQRGWLCAVGGFVHRTLDGGQSWSIVGSVPHSYTEEIVMEDQQTGWLVARNHAGGGPDEDGRGFIYRTADGGASWILEWAAPWIGGSLSDLARDKDGTLWAAGQHATLLVYRDPAAAEMQPPITVRGLQLSGAQPMLHPSEVRLAYALERAAPVDVRICDSAGRLVRCLQDGWQSAGRHAVAWDGTDGGGRPLPAGLYFATLRTPADRSGIRILRLR
ncbi:MAG: hypothetical protein GF330_04985 [Candidatus Eisenbacteria bacterium]|nr:hypothetical protein [Candidatus Eisenbacteria bacterium]